MIDDLPLLLVDAAFKASCLDPDDDHACFITYCTTIGTGSTGIGCLRYGYGCGYSDSIL